MKRIIVALLSCMVSLVCSAQSIKIHPKIYLEVPFSYLQFWFYEETDEIDSPEHGQAITNVSVAIKCGDIVDKVYTGERNSTVSSASFPSTKLVFRFECEGYEPFETKWDQTELSQCLLVCLKKSEKTD